MKKKSLYMRMMLLIVALILSACSSNPVQLKQNSFVMELGEQVSTKVQTYVNEDTEKDILKETSIMFEKSKSYTIDEKLGILQPTNGKYLSVGKYNGYVKFQDYKEDFIVDIKDSTAPKFVDFKEEILIEVGSEVKLEEYFKAEDLSQVTISINKDKLDPTKEGSYEIQVTATDQYKNKETKKATVKVTAKEVVEEPVEENANYNTTNNAGGTTPGNNAQAPSNGYSSSTGGDSTQTPSQPQQSVEPNVCVPNGTYGRLGNSGKVFNSKIEADAWATNYIDSQAKPWKYFGWHAITVIDSCGNERDDLWTVGFY